MQRDRRSSAFTLIEILIVIVIIAVMAGIVVPAYVRYLDRVRFDTSVKRVQDLFAYAREQALNADAPVSVRFDHQSEAFAVIVQPKTPPSDTPVAFTTGDNAQMAATAAQLMPRTLQLDPNQMITQYSVMPNDPTVVSAGQPAGMAAQNEVHFQRDGTSDAVELVLAQSDGRTAHLMLMPATGRMILDDGSPRP